MCHVSRPRPILLLILDGWGHRAETAHNAIALANVPNWRRLLAQCPHTLVDTHGEHVGLPDGQMGNSEVGHMNIGSGRIVYQDLTRIDAAIEDDSFYTNAELRSACEGAKASGGTAPGANRISIRRLLQPSMPTRATSARQPGA